MWCCFTSFTLCTKGLNDSSYHLHNLRIGYSLIETIKFFHGFPTKLVKGIPIKSVWHFLQPGVFGTRYLVIIFLNLFKKLVENFTFLY